MKAKIITCCLIIFIVSLLTVVATGCWYVNHFFQKPIQFNSDNNLFTLKRGTSINQLANQLEQQALIKDAFLLPYLLKVNPSLKNIKSGTYQLTASMSLKQFLQLLNSGKEAQFNVKLIEGKTFKDWLLVLKNTNYIEHQLAELTPLEIAQQLKLDTPLEGWLFPDTYSYTINSSDIDLIKRAYLKMQMVLEDIWENRAEDLPYKSPYELLIMASIIEKETGLDSERSKVASVFINRLKKRMLLQTDPTIIYGMGDNYNGQILTKDLRDKTNPYNTYIISGLPPTPIAMPGKASLEAAAHPDQTDYLYFVADGLGGHTFSTDYTSHKKAVENYWRLMRSR